MDRYDKSKPEQSDQKIEVGDKPRQYAPGSVVDVDEVVEGSPETARGLSIADPIEDARADDLHNRVLPGQKPALHQDNRDYETGAAPTNQQAHDREYVVTHNEEAVPNYRDETYRDPGETLLEGQSAEKYDQQKRAVDDGSRFIPPNR